MMKPITIQYVLCKLPKQRMSDFSRSALMEQHTFSGVIGCVFSELFLAKAIVQKLDKTIIATTPMNSLSLYAQVIYQQIAMNKGRRTLKEWLEQYIMNPSKAEGMIDALIEEMQKHEVIHFYEKKGLLFTKKRYRINQEIVSELNCIIREQLLSNHILEDEMVILLGLLTSNGVSIKTYFKKEELSIYKNRLKEIKGNSLIGLIQEINNEIMVVTSVVLNMTMFNTD